MADASDEISDDVWGVIGLIFLVVVGYWFFSEDDIEDVAQYALESAFDGDEDAIAELDANYIDWGGRFNMWLDDVDDIGFTSIFVGASFLNMELAERSEQVVRDFERHAENHDGVDEVEIVASGTKEVPQPDMSFWEWVVSFFAPEIQIVDEKGAAMAKVTFDDGTVEFYEQSLSHVDSSDYTVEGWVVNGWSRRASFKGDNEDKISDFEEKTIERYENRYED